MENATQAFMMAFGVFTLVIALSISIFLFARVIESTDIILKNVDRENSYLWIENAGTERTVSIETIIPTIYRALDISYGENYRIEFYNSNGTKYCLYRNNGQDINTIDLAEEDSGWNDNNVFLKYLIYGEIDDDKKNEYPADLLDNGLYSRLKGKKITEYLGEYYIGDENNEENQERNVSEINKTKKRVIVYVIN